MNSNVAIQDRITVSGTVNPILKDGATLNANAGITITGATLNIYAQENGTGALKATGNPNRAVIGDTSTTDAASITDYLKGRTETQLVEITNAKIEDASSFESLSGGWVLLALLVLSGLAAQREKYAPRQRGKGKTVPGPRGPGTVCPRRRPEAVSPLDFFAPHAVLTL